MTVDRRLELRGVSVPAFLYGTAWKEDRTEELTRLALAAGFLGIDTANQRRHYVEAAVGAAVDGFRRDANVAREDLFLQTKFTSAGGQDRRLPYDPSADAATQAASPSTARSSTCVPPTSIHTSCTAPPRAAG